MTFWKTASFKALQIAWYQRLEEGGFRDEEKLIGEEMQLRQSSTHVFKNKLELDRAIKEYYYSLLAQRVREADFRNEIDQLILALHAEGAKIKVICEELEKRGKPRCRNTVSSIIKIYEMKWGIKEYTPNQLNRYNLRLPLLLIR